MANAKAPQMRGGGDESRFVKEQVAKELVAGSLVSSTRLPTSSMSRSVGKMGHAGQEDFLCVMN